MVSEKGDSQSRRAAQRGQRYDASLRWMVERNTDGLCRLLGLPATEQPQILSADLPTSTRYADLVMRVADDHLVHVEYMRTSASDLIARMLIYRGLIMAKYPEHRITQYILVLGTGLVKGHDDLATTGFALTVNIIYARDEDPSVFLDGPGLAPLAVLGRGSRDDRAKAYLTAVALIRKHGGPDATALLEFAELMAGIRLDRSTIEQIVKEAGMTPEEAAYNLEWITEEFGEPMFIRSMREDAREEGLSAGRKAGLEAGRQEGLSLGRKEGISAGREVGRDQARVEDLTALLRERFGDQPDLPTTAERLAHWPDIAAAMRAILRAGSLGDLPARPAQA